MSDSESKASGSRGWTTVVRKKPLPQDRSVTAVSAGLIEEPKSNDSAAPFKVTMYGNETENAAPSELAVVTCNSEQMKELTEYMNSGTQSTAIKVKLPLARDVGKIRVERSGGLEQSDWESTFARFNKTDMSPSSKGWETRMQVVADGKITSHPVSDSLDVDTLDKMPDEGTSNFHDVEFTRKRLEHPSKSHESGLFKLTAWGVRDLTDKPSCVHEADKNALLIITDVLLGRDSKLEITLKNHLTDVPVSSECKKFTVHPTEGGFTEASLENARFHDTLEDSAIPKWTKAELFVGQTGDKKTVTGRVDSKHVLESVGQMAQGEEVDGWRSLGARFARIQDASVIKSTSG